MCLIWWTLWAFATSLSKYSQIILQWHLSYHAAKDDERVHIRYNLSHLRRHIRKMDYHVFINGLSLMASINGWIELSGMEVIFTQTISIEFFVQLDQHYQCKRKLLPQLPARMTHIMWADAVKCRTCLISLPLNRLKYHHRTPITPVSAQHCSNR